MMEISFCPLNEGGATAGVLTGLVLPAGGSRETPAPKSEGLASQGKSWYQRARANHLSPRVGLGESMQAAATRK